jgi:hypothetical protein
MNFSEWLQFEEGKKDACYYKVKARYSVWPSAYGSGSLVKCRKVGAANWGKNESTNVDKQECSFCTSPATSIEMWDEEVPVCDQCSAGISEGTFDLEKSQGLHGWFARNKGKGWIDCKASKKGHLVQCGREKAGKGAERKYPACRPTLSACNKSKHKKKTSKPIRWENNDK